MPSLARSQDAYDRFSAVVELPLAILALLWLPILVLPLVASLPVGIADTFYVIDYLVWAVFVVEYLIRLYLAPAQICVQLLRRTSVGHAATSGAVTRRGYGYPCAGSRQPLPPRRMLTILSLAAGRGPL